MPLAAKLARLAVYDDALASAGAAVEEAAAGVKAADRGVNVLEHDVVEAEVELARLRDAAADSSSALAGGGLGGLEGARAAIDSLVATEVSHRAAAVLQFKASADAASAGVAVSNAEAAAGAAAVAAARRGETAALAAGGQNPYEVFRRRERDAASAGAVRAAAVRVAEHENEIAARVLAEEAKHGVAVAAAARDAEAAARYRGSLSRPVREAATSAYIRSRVIGGAEVLDPSGRHTEGVQPSTVTTLKPAAFGTGRVASTRPDILAAVAARASNAGVATLAATLPRAARGTASGTRGGGEEEDDMDGMGGAAALDDEGGTAPAVPRLRGAGGDELASSTAPSPPRGPRARSVYEARMAADALARQRANITATQVVAGRTYVGPGFACDPPTIEFTDFEPGVPMTRRVRITNVSLSFNSFRLSPLPDDLRDLFEFDFTPPGRMSAGMACPMRITFTPRRNVDVTTALTLLAHTGEVGFPMRATTRKLVPSLDVAAVAVPGTVLGERTTVVVTLSNAGVIPATVAVSLADVSAEAAGAFTAPPEVELGPYTSVRLPLTFAPRAVGAATGRLVVALRPVGPAPGVVPVELTVPVTAAGVDVPLYAAQPVMEFGTAVVGKSYRATLVVRNRGAVALRCSPIPAPQLAAAGSLEVVPTSGYVQARDAGAGVDGAFAFSIRFTPNVDLAAAMVRSTPGAAPLPAGGPTASGGGGSATWSLPVRFDMVLEAPDQVLPVPLALTATLTTPALALSTGALAFGRCSVGQAVSATLTVTNLAILPATVALDASAAPGFSVAPGGGAPVVGLLPGASATFTVVFSPSAAVAASGTLRLTSTMGAAYDVSVSGVGVAPLLHLSHGALVLAATAAGEAQPGAVTLTNVADTPLLFQVLGPAREADEHSAGVSGADASSAPPLFVSPRVGTLPAGGAVRLLLTYEPALSAPLGSATWLLPIVAMPAGSTVTTARGGGGGGGRDDGSSLGAAPRAPPVPAVAGTATLRVVTTTVERTLSAMPTSLAFGTVAIGGRKALTVRVANDSDHALALTARVDDVASCFEVGGAPAMLLPHSYDTVTVTFAPGAAVAAAGALLLRAGASSNACMVPLRGEGVHPTLALTPPEARAIDFGAVVAGDRAVRSFALRNVSAFPIKYGVRCVAGGDGRFSASPLPVYNVEPPQGVIEPGATATLTAAFAPRHAPPGAAPLTASFAIDVAGGGGGAIMIALTGRSFDRAGYLLPANLALLPSPAAAAAMASPLATDGDAADPAAGSTLEVTFPLLPPPTAAPPAPAPPPAAAVASGAAAPPKAAAVTAGGTKGAAAAPVAEPAGVTEAMTLFCIDRDAYGTDTVPLPVAGVGGSAAPAGAVTGSAAAAKAKAPAPAPSGGGGKPPAGGAAAAAAGAGAAAPPVVVQQGPVTYAVALVPVPDGTGAAPLPHFFTVEPPSGTLAPGASAPLVFRHAPPRPGAPPPPGSGRPGSATDRAPAPPVAAAASSTRSDVGGEAAGVVSAGYWSVGEARVTLTGGYVAPVRGAPAAPKTYTVRLKGFVPSTL